MENEQLNDTQTKIAQLQEKGWTLAALADEIGVTVNAVEKWKAGDRTPSSLKATLAFLDRLLERKRIPKKRRYITKFSIGDNIIGNDKKASYRGEKAVVIRYHRPTNEYEIQLENGEVHYVSPSWFDKLEI